MTTKEEIIISAREDTRAAFDSVNRNLAKMNTQVSGVVSAFKSLAQVTGVSISVAGLVGLVKGAVDAQDNLNDLSKKTAIAITDLAGLEVAALKSGSNLEDIGASINKLSIAIGKEPEKFRAVGISAKDPIEAFKQLADVFNAIEDPQERAAFGAAALGKSWAGAAPLLAEGSKSIGEMIDKGKALSKVTEESARKADELNDQLVDLDKSAKVLRDEFAMYLVPSILSTVKAMNAAIEASGGLGKGLMMWATNIGEGNDNPSKMIVEVVGKLKTLKALRDDLSKPTLANKINNALFSDLPQVEEQIKYNEKRLKYLQLLNTNSSDVKPTGWEAKLGDKDRVSTSSAAVRKFLGGQEPKAAKADKAAKEDPYTDQLTPAAEAYAKAIEAINSAQAGAEKSTMKLNGAQETLYDLMNSQVWQDMPEAWQEVVIAQSQAASESIKIADETKRLNDLMAATPGEKYAKLADDINFLAAAYNDAKISAEQLDEASQAALAGIVEKAKDADDAMSEFAKQAARNMQDAFADFLFDPFKDGTKNMLENFGVAIRHMVANAVAADLSNKLFGKAAGGEGDGLLGGALGWLGGLFKNADGGVYPTAALAAYSGRIVTQPTLFAFARGAGVMGEAGAEAILPLKRGADGKLGVAAQGGSGHTINVYVSGTNAPDVRRAAGQGAREAMAALSRAGRYS